MNQVISFSLWGNNPKYTIGAIRNAELAQTIYPEWTCYFYVNEKTVPEDILNKLKNIPRVVIKNMGGSDSWSNLLWRFQTCLDPTINVSIFRDTDSRLNLREKAAVDVWLSQPETFHIMRDHPYHRFPILGGMWGYKNNGKYNMQALLSNYIGQDRYGTDYLFLSHMLYPKIGNDKIVHDEFFDDKPFPTNRENLEFVGDVFDEYDNRHPNFFKYIQYANKRL